MDKYANENINQFFLHLVNRVTVMFAEFTLLNRNVLYLQETNISECIQILFRSFDFMYTLNIQERIFHIM
jgi:hypothetical protein